MRGRISVGRWLFAALLIPVLLVGAAIQFAPQLARAAIVAFLEMRDVPVRTLEVRTVGLEEATFGRIELGVPAGPSAAAARVAWIWDDLLAGRLDRVTLHEPRISLTLADSNINVVGMPSFTSGTGDGAVPFRQLEVVNGTLRAATPLGGLVATMDATVSGAGRVAQLERMTVSRAALDFAKGTVSVTKVLYQRERPLDAILDIEGVDLGEMLAFLGVEGLSGSGVLDGTIPIHLDPSGLGISGGRVVARGPGILRYTGEGLPAGGGDKSVTERLTLVRQALANFRYKTLTLGLDRAPNGEGSLTAKLAGANPDLMQGHPFDINVRFDTNFDKLATILLQGYAAAGRLLRPIPSR